MANDRIPELYQHNEFVDLESGVDLLGLATISKVSKSFTSSTSYGNKEERNVSAKVLLFGVGMIASVTCSSPSIAKPSVSPSQSCDVDDYLKNVANPIRSYMKEISFNRASSEEQLSCVDTYADRQDLISEINSFKNLEEDWDGEGAIPLSERSADNAINFVQRLNPVSLANISYISLNPNSTVAFVWDNERGEKISLNIGSQVFSYYAKLNPEENTKFFNDVEVSTESINQLDEFVNRLL